MKQSLKLSVLFVLSIAILAACGNADQSTMNNASPTENGQNEVQNDMKASMDQLNFYEFDLDVSYGRDKEYEAELKSENNRIEAKIEDDLNNVYISGKEAFDDLYPRVKELSLTSKSSDQDAINQILKAFDLPDNYEKFELEIDFNDNSKLDVEHKK